MTRWSLIAPAVALAALLWIATPTAAETDGNCTATIQGVDLAGHDSSDTDQAIEVAENGTVDFSFESPAGVKGGVVSIEYGPLTTDLAEVAPDEPVNGINGSASVKAYAKYGTGVYIVYADAALADGTACHSKALVLVSGNPLTTLAGAGAAAAVGLGAAGLVYTVWAGLRP